MKNLIKAEVFIIWKQKSKLLLIPLLIVIYFIGMVFANESHTEYLNDEKKLNLAIQTRLSHQRKDDECVLGLYSDSKSNKKCGKEYYTEKEVEFAESRNSFNTEFSQNLFNMHMSLEFNDDKSYLENREKMLMVAKDMQEAGFNNAFYIENNLFEPEDNSVLETEINLISIVLANDYQPLMSPYQIDGSNYLRVFLSNGGLILIIMATLLFNMDVFIDENSRSVNNVLYTLAYSRRKINFSKVIVSIIYSLLAIILSLTLSYFISGYIFGYGSLNYPLIIRSNLNSFNLENLNTYVIASIKTELIYTSFVSLLILFVSLLIMHLSTIVLQSASTGLFLVALLLSSRFILKSTLNDLFKYFPFAYDNMHAVFYRNYNYLYGIGSLSLIVVLLLGLILYIGSKIDIKVGD